MKQASLIPMARRPSPTATITRANRRKARAWAEARGLKTWAKGEDSCGDSHPEAPVLGCSIGGVNIPRNVPLRPLVLCWDCCPYPDAPVCNHESWCSDAERGNPPCIRCLRQGRGGTYFRGGPFCWDCGSPPKDVYEAWLLRLRTEPDAAPPWRGDKAKAA